MVYLADNSFYEATGQTITGNTYKWDNHGPNAVDHLIVDTAHMLVAANKICTKTRTSMYAGDAYDYWVDDSKVALEDATSKLDEGEFQIILDTVKSYGDLAFNPLVTASKETRPFKNARKGEVLSMKQNENAQKIQAMLDSSPEFLQEVEKGFEDAEAGRWVWDEDVD